MIEIIWFSHWFISGIKNFRNAQTFLPSHLFKKKNNCYSKAPQRHKLSLLRNWTSLFQCHEERLRTFSIFSWFSSVVFLNSFGQTANFEKEFFSRTFSVFLLERNVFLPRSFPIVKLCPLFFPKTFFRLFSRVWNFFFLSRTNWNYGIPKSAARGPSLSDSKPEKTNYQAVNDNFILKT